MLITLPEQVELEFEPASFGSRALAYILDFIIRWGSVVLTILLLYFLLRSDTTATIHSTLFSKLPAPHKSGSGVYLLTFFSLLFFIVEWSYPLFFEICFDGATPGKRLFGLRVVDEQGLRISAKASFLRTILLAIDLIPGVALVGFISMALSKRSQRLGDLVAKTVVVYEDKNTFDVKDLLSTRDNVEQTPLPLDRYRVLETYVKRCADLSPETRTNARTQLLSALGAPATKLPPPPPLPEEEELWLKNLYARAVPEKKQYRSQRNLPPTQWRGIDDELRSCAADLVALEKRRGTVPATELRKSAESYQKLCQRYAYLSTFYPATDPTEIAGRLVRFGRRLIYGKRLTTVNDTRLSFWKRVPQSFHAVRSYCFFSVALCLISAFLAAGMVYLNPSLGWHFLSEEVAANLAHGKLWTEDIQGLSPLASSKIMTNNISVSLLAFAMGITGGVGTVILLIFNGALLGGMFVALVPYHMGFRLLDFVVAHGFLELSVIAIAGGCGLAIGDALLHPGTLSRKAALQERAKVSIDLLLFSALCLVPAGITEGFISPYETVPFVGKLAWGILMGGMYWRFLVGSLLR